MCVVCKSFFDFSVYVCYLFRVWIGCYIRLLKNLEQSIKFRKELFYFIVQ